MDMEIWSLLSYEISQSTGMDVDIVTEENKVYVSFETDKSNSFILRTIDLMDAPIGKHSLKEAYHQVLLKILNQSL